MKKQSVSVGNLNYRQLKHTAMFFALMKGFSLAVPFK